MSFRFRTSRSLKLDLEACFFITPSSSLSPEQDKLLCSVILRLHGLGGRGQSWCNTRSLFLIKSVGTRTRRLLVSGKNKEEEQEEGFMINRHQFHLGGYHQKIGREESIASTWPYGSRST